MWTEPRGAKTTGVCGGDHKHPSTCWTGVDEVSAPHSPSCLSTSSFLLSSLLWEAEGPELLLSFEASESRS